MEEIIEPLIVQAEPQAWRYIGEEVSEQLDYEPARFLRHRVIRRKYVKRGDLDCAPVIAPLPPVLQERCIAAPGLLAQVIVAKYCDHLPLYRQEQIYASRHGVALPRQTLARWMGLAADWLAPIYEHIRAGVVSGSYIQMDETPLTTSNPATARRAKVICGCVTSPAVMLFTTGTPAGQRSALRKSSRWTSVASSNATGMQAIAVS